MTNISKRKVNENIDKALTDQFLTFFTAARSKKDAAVLAGELFSETEQIMFAKRLAIVVMLERGYTFEEIQKTIKVSPDTVTRIWRERKKGRFAKIARYARDHTGHFQKGSQLLKTLEALLTVPGAAKMKRRMLSKEQKRLSAQ
ncbi:MAG: Trp family transcriptional regulator [Candidatus Paceibacteria bacterium]